MTSKIAHKTLIQGASKKKTKTKRFDRSDERYYSSSGLSKFK